ncbi:MAG: hypothetical protein HF976_04425 [ANME-2 cluster archaeon]|nr:hypothetical protein [ANME-2 cluster archaeon]MBC2700650.1 hypothetical protein [ANME-2 cluster archaeon]MBC2706211.1 hypothetical protein [ANME-2 cluster archaeon]MBC2746732.1 hypothetical protein [ANME-2 cluster archaeon]MBC2762355.1 hypothetical protein [ANME-2 cluster archaeon]
MNSRIILLVTGLLLSSIYLTVGTASAEPSRYLQVESITMTLEGPDATFNIEFELDIIAQMYVLFLGTGSIKSAIYDIFDDFDNVEVLSVRKDSAVVKVMNVSYHDPEQGGNMFFHDSHNLGTNVYTFKLVFPSGVERIFYDVSTTPNTFFEA